MMYNVEIIFKGNTSVNTKFISLNKAIEYIQNYSIAMNDIYFKNPIKKVTIEEV